MIFIVMISLPVELEAFAFLMISVMSLTEGGEVKFIRVFRD